MTVCYSTIKIDITAKKLPQITFCKASSSESDSSHLKSLSPLDHEGADTRMILHCSKQRLKNVIIYTVDSDVVVISVHFFDALSLTPFGSDLVSVKESNSTRVFNSTSSLQHPLPSNIALFVAVSTKPERCGINHWKKCRHFQSQRSKKKHYTEQLNNYQAETH